MKPLATLRRLKRRVRVLTAQKCRLARELRAAQAVRLKQPLLPRQSEEHAS